MKLSTVERLILSNQYTIRASLEPDLRNDHLRAAEALRRGYQSEWSDLFEPIHDAFPTEVTGFVRDIMDLYLALQSFVESVGEDAVFPPGFDARGVVFPGFDGNHEVQHMAFAEYLRHTGRFERLELTGDNVNSNCPMRDRYRKALEVWSQMASPVALDQERFTELFLAIHSRG